MTTQPQIPRDVSPFRRIAREVGDLVTEKNEAYGDSFAKSGDILRILYPHGVSPEQLDDCLFLARMIDKMFRIATNRDAFGERPERDMGGYCVLQAALREYQAWSRAAKDAKP